MPDHTFIGLAQKETHQTAAERNREASTSSVPRIYHRNDREVAVARIDRNKSINRTIQRLKNLTRDNTSAKPLIFMSCKLRMLCKKVRQSQVANLHKSL